MQRIRSIIGRYKIEGDVKNSIGNGEAKELICTIHGHKLSRGLLEGKEVLERGGKQGKIGTTVIA